MVYHADILVIGSGGAGLSAAIEAKRGGKSVLVASKTYPTRSATSMAQGGINAVLANPDDTISQHIEDTFNAGGSVGARDAIETMCKSAPETITWLDSIGVPFTVGSDGKTAQRTLGGASHPRACYAQDYSGLKILHTLYDTAQKEEVQFLNEFFLLEIITKDNSAVGALFWDMKKGELASIYASSIILAGGGFSKIYGKYSTNSTSQNGDIIAIASRAGAKVSHMAYVQFHPTALKNAAVLISESARGAGGKLLNQKGERFVDELAPRDVVSRAIYAQEKMGNNVFLDISHLDETLVKEELPQERKLAILYENIDPLDKPIPVSPAAHYTMGGISVDAHTRTSVDGLYAIGECAQSGVHGANRLGGNSLLEIVVFGRISGKIAASQSVKKNPSCEGFVSEKIQRILEKPSCENIFELREMLSDILYIDAGIVRTVKGLAHAKEAILTLQKRLLATGVQTKSKVYNIELITYLELENSLDVAEMLVTDAQAQTQSIGAHFMEEVS